MLAAEIEFKMVETKREGKQREPKKDTPDTAHDGTENQGKKKKRRREKKKRKGANETDCQEQTNLKKKAKRPNVFIALRFTNPEVHSQIRRFQEHAVAANSNLAQTCVPVRKAHISMHVLNINVDDLEKVRAAMENAADVMAGEPIAMHVEGTENFKGGHVVYGKIGQGREETQILWKKLQEELAAAGFDVEKKDDFHPHVTLLKTSRAKVKDVRKMKIRLEYYHEMADMNFGKQVCSKLQLLSMNEPEASDGYYKVLAEVPFSPVSPDEAIDHTECCRPVRLQRPSAKPNAFLSLQISNPEVHAQIRHFLEHAVTANRDLIHTCTLVPKAHVSLQFLNIGDGDVERLVTSLKKVAGEMGGNPIVMHLEGTENFGGGRAVCAKILEGREETVVLWKKLNAYLLDAGFFFSKEQNKDFIPHVTLLKMRSDKRKEMCETTKIARECYAELAEMNFGRQVCSRLQLVSITEQDSDGLNKVLADVPFSSSSPDEATDHTECCRPVRLPRSTAPRPDPNIFLSLQISNPEIHAKARMLQMYVIQKRLDLRQICYPVSFSHVSLQVMNVDEDRVGEVVDAVKVVASSRAGRPLNLRFSGTGDFYSRVVFAKLEEEEEVRSLYDALQEELESRRVVNGGLNPRPFSPHLTLLKTMQATCEEVMKMELSKDIYEEMADITFGSQVCTKIQILSMTNSENNSYYHSLGEVEFADAADTNESTDHSQCCKPLPKSWGALFWSELGASYSVVPLAAACVAFAVVYMKYRRKT
jgi:2'-5' RNA ligase